MIIIGAGMAGLLAGTLNQCPIYEAGPKKYESNHKAIFRCRTDKIGKMLGIPFKKVMVHKAIWYCEKEVNPTPRIGHMYSKKVSGIYSNRSIFDTDSVVRYIPPADFTDRLKSRCEIYYGVKVNNIEGADLPIISTIPMYFMAEICKHELGMNTQFNFKQIYVNRLKIQNCDSHCTIYYPESDFSVYRASLCGDTLITEGTDSLKDFEISTICNSIGINSDLIDVPDFFDNHVQTIGKMSPIDNSIREKIIVDMTLKHGVYSLGRFATWRPKLMMDDVLDDIFVIRRLISEGNYGSLKHKQGEKL